MRKSFTCGLTHPHTVILSPQDLTRSFVWTENASIGNRHPAHIIVGGTWSAKGELGGNSLFSLWLQSVLFVVRDRSLNIGRGGRLQNGKIAGLKLFAPRPSSRHGKTLCAPTLPHPHPTFKGWKDCVPPPPITMAKTSHSHVKTCCAPLQHG